MRAKSRFVPLARSPRLYRTTEERFTSYWTESLGTASGIVGERIVEDHGRLLRRFDPVRSKLAAAIARGWTEPLPKPGERWLYLGAASGTTASHVADLLGPAGVVIAVEKSLRSFARLLMTAERYPNLGPVLADARAIERYVDLVPPVDGIYVDIAQPDQVEIALLNAQELLRSNGSLLLALKTSSMGRGASPRAHLDRAEERLSEAFELAGSVALDPFHRKHYLVGAYATKRLARDPDRPRRG